MKKIIIKFIPWVLIAAMFIALIPGLMLRLENEADNKNIVMSILYNDLYNKVSDKDRIEILKEFQDNGINTIAIMEDDLNMMVAAGEVTCIKYNVLLHKYDEESMIIGDTIKAACPDVTFDSYIILTKRPESMKTLAYHMPRRYTDKQYCYVDSIDGTAIYVLYNGQKNLWDYAIGYNEDDIKLLKGMGFDISLIHKVKNYKNTEYLKDIDRIVKEYDIEYLNLKEDSVEVKKDEAVKANYEGLADIINNNNMTLVVTENTNQLSNQKFFGYSDLFDSVMYDRDGSHKVMRSYETYDDSQSIEDGYSHRVSQHFNSTIDRNIRFITITQITGAFKDYKTLADYTIKAAVEYKEKVEEQGFKVGSEEAKFDYNANARLNYAASAVIMIMAALIMLRCVFSKQFTGLTVIALILSVIGFAGTYLLYSRFESLISLYPTLFCLVLSCFAMTMVLSFIKSKRDSLGLPLLTLGTVIIMLGSIFIGTIGMGAMLSGIDYYVNNDIFRGIKLSLLVPIVYTAVIYYLMFMKDTSGNLIKKIPAFLNSQIRVYWVILAGIILAIGAYYIIRSGNVNSISVFEQKIRTALTEMFTARPRTKEFLIGYPALILLVYYMKKIDIKLFQWLLAIASSILAASITNSFCHVFTDYTVILSRTINGLIVGIAVSVFAFVANIILVKAVKHIYKIFAPQMEIK